MRFALVLAAMILAAVVLSPAPTSASQGGTALLIADHAAGQVGFGTVEFTVACDSDGEVVEPSADDRQFFSLTCWVDGTTPVYFGGTSTTTSTGIPVCEDAACANGGTGIYRSPVKRGGTGCRTSAGSVTIRCQGPATR